MDVALVWAAVLVATGFVALCWTVFCNNSLISALALLDERNSSSNKRLLAGIYWASPLFFLALWIVAAYLGWGGGRWFPTPGELGGSAWRLIVTGDLLGEAWISFKRVAVGFLSALVVGVSFGLLLGAFLLPRQLLLPLNSFLRYIPPTAFIALLIVYFGVGENYKYAVVFFGLIFFITQMVVDVVDDVDVRFVEMAQTSDFSVRDVFSRVIVPASLPRILDVLRINLGAAWTFLVAAELIGAESGLGHLIAVSQRFMRLGDLFVGILAFGVIGLASDRVLDVAGRRMFRWYHLSLGKGE